jgi:general secretion pathway protein G
MVTISPIRNTNPSAPNLKPGAPELRNPKPNSKPVISTGDRAPRQLCWLGWRRGAFAAAAVEKSASQLRPSRSPNRRRSESGFTLIELMIVMVVIGLLAAIAIPAYTTNIKHAREAVLKEDLHVMRQAIDSYTVDKQKAPQSLDDLVQSGYIKVMPIDPFTHRSDTWMPVQSDTLSTLDQTASGIDDVHSGSQETAIDGTSYNSW